MRLTVLMQYIKGLEASDPETGSKVSTLLESSKTIPLVWQCCRRPGIYWWVQHVLRWSQTQLCRSKIPAKTYWWDVYLNPEQSDDDPQLREMHRYGEPVSTAFVESTINEVIAKRMAKKQQMQWSRKGAHYLLQTRTAALNNELQDKFACWYPGFSMNGQSGGKIALMAA